MKTGEDKTVAKTVKQLFENTRRYIGEEILRVMAAGLMIAVLGACAPTARNTGEHLK